MYNHPVFVENTQFVHKVISLEEESDLNVQESRVGIPSETSVDEGISVCEHYTQPRCSCILYLKNVKGLNIKGNAIDLKPTHYNDPQHGDVALFRYENGVGHAAFVEAAMPKAIYVSEWNYKEGKYTERTIMLNNPSIYGYLRL